MARESSIISRIRKAEGDRFGISITVLGELHYAVYASQQRERNTQRLRALVDALLLWPFDEETAREFGRIRAEQKAAGNPIPPVDAQIAAVARIHGLTVLTSDRHFRFVSGITVQDWQS